MLRKALARFIKWNPIAVVCVARQRIRRKLNAILHTFRLCLVYREPRRLPLASGIRHKRLLRYYASNLQKINGFNMPSEIKQTRRGTPIGVYTCAYINRSETNGRKERLQLLNYNYLFKNCTQLMFVTFCCCIFASCVNE